jgi:hypothetical protein
MEAKEIKEHIRILLGTERVTGRAMTPGRPRKQLGTVEVRFMTAQREQNRQKLLATTDVLEMQRIKGQIAFCDEAILKLLAEESN